CCVMIFFFFFFFQAEDGIRDLIVTGVQTCALPICPGRRLDQLRGLGPARRQRRGLGRPGRGPHASLPGGRLTAATYRLRPRAGRSEERRVGKEGRGRWGGERVKKKDACE